VGPVSFLVRINSRTSNFDPTDPINFFSATLKWNCPNRGNFCAGISIRAHNRVQVHRTIPHGLFRRHFALIIQMSLHAAEIIASYVAPLLSTTSLRDANRQCKRIYLKKSGKMAIWRRQNSYRIGWAINYSLIFAIIIYEIICSIEILW